MNKIRTINNININQLMLKPLERVDKDGVNVDSPNITFDKQKCMNEEHASVSLSLRDKVQIIQAIKNVNKIENQAAVFGGGIGEAVVVGLISGALGWGAKRLLDYVTEKSPNSEIESAIASAMKVLSDEGLWNNDLTNIDESNRDKAVNKIIGSDIKEPQVVTTKIESALEKILSDSNESTSDKDLIAVRKQAIRAFFAALEGLYQRNDVKLQSGNELPFYEKFVPYLSENKPLIDDGAKFHMRKILVLNWKVPINEYKIPNPDSRNGDYRFKMYEAILDTLIEPFGAGLQAKASSKDLLYLSTDYYDIPSNLRDKALELREALITNYRLETKLVNNDSTKYSQSARKKLGEVLASSKQINPLTWSEDAKIKHEQDEKYNRIFNKFKSWGCELSQMSESELKECFGVLVAEYEADKNRCNSEFSKGYENRLDNDLEQLRYLFLKDERYSVEDLNEIFSHAWKLMNLNPEQYESRLRPQNYWKLSFFYECLNKLVDKKITIGANPPVLFKNLLSEENKNRILKACSAVVHRNDGFAVRDFLFFKNPTMQTIPGKALSLYQKLSRHFGEDEGYVDIYGLEDRVVKNVVDNVYSNSNQPATSGWLFSGPKGTGKTFFAEALANQMALPLFVLSPGMIQYEAEDIYVNVFNSGKMHIGEFFVFIKENSPCVLLLDEIEGLMVPRLQDDKYQRIPTDRESSLTQVFLNFVQSLRDKRNASRVTVLATTNVPSTINVELNEIDKDGNCPSAEQSLYNFVSCNATRDRRIDHKIFLFHKLYNREQGEALAKRFIQPYVDLGKVSTDIDYAQVGNEISDYTPAQIESSFAEVINKNDGEIDVAELVKHLKNKNTGRKELRERIADKVKLLDSYITTLVKAMKLKKITTTLDFVELAYKSEKLSDMDIFNAIKDLTPETLTQENIIAAFEQMGKKD